MPAAATPVITHAVRLRFARAVRRRSAGALLAIGALCAALLAGPGAAGAAERKLALDYRVYVGGFRTVDMRFDYRFAPDRYALKLRLDARGVLEWFFTWNMTAMSEGRLADGRVIPVKARARSSWKGRERSTDLVFPADGGVPVATSHPASRDDGRDRVPDALRRGTVDLAAAIMALLRTADATGRCDHTAQVFDGRRRYALVFTHEGEDRLAANDYSAFSGAALRCGLRLKPIAGFRKKRSRMGWVTSDSATVWLARLFPDTRPVPVRIQLETIAGTLIGHLTAATLSGAGPAQRLALRE